VLGRYEFEPVLDAFDENFDAHAEVGAAVCVYVDGRPVVDLWGGLADATTGREWEPDTVTLVYSSTERRHLGVRQPAHRTRPARSRRHRRALLAEFAANGKEAITVRQALKPPGRLAVCGRRLHAQRSTGLDPIVTAIATQGSIWPPGTQHGYHMRTFGWIVGEIIRRVEGRTVGAFCVTRSPTSSTSTSGSDSRGDRAAGRPARSAEA